MMDEGWAATTVVGRMDERDVELTREQGEGRKEGRKLGRKKGRKRERERESLQDVWNDQTSGSVGEARWIWARRVPECKLCFFFPPSLLPSPGSSLSRALPSPPFFLSLA